jgi:hypothetical protein
LQVLLLQSELQAIHDADKGKQVDMLACYLGVLAV